METQRDSSRSEEMSETPRTDEQHALFPMGGFTLDFARQLERELAAAKQIMGELCESCGWAMRFPDQPCRCELERELAEARDQLEGAGKLMTACDVLVRDLAEAREQRDTLVKALSMYGLPYSDEDLEYMAQNPSPHTHEAKRELIRRQALAAVKENHE